MGTGLLKLIVVLLFIFDGFCSAAIITAEQTNEISVQAEKIYEDFIQSSFDARMEYIFYGSLNNKKLRQTLLSSAQKAAHRISKVIDKQEKLKAEIENYQGGDWDTLYGENRLWRKLAGDIQKSSTLKLHIDYYRDLLSGKLTEQQKKPTLKKLLEVTNRICDSNSIECGIFAAKKFRAGKSDIEFRKSIEEFPNLRRYLCKLAAERIQSDYENTGKFNGITLLDVRLACLGFLNGYNNLNYSVICALAEKKEFLCPVVLYSCFESLKDTDCDRAVEYLIESAELQRQFDYSWLGIESSSLDKITAERAYAGLVEGEVDCGTAGRAFSYYLSKHHSDTDYRLKYNVGCGLLFCKDSKGTEILERVKDNENAGIFRYKSELQLLKNDALKLSKEDSNYPKLLNAIERLIEKCAVNSGKGYNFLMRECVNFHCGLLSEVSNRNSAGKILKELSMFSELSNNELVYQAQAHLVLGNYTGCGESLSYLSLPSGCGYARRIYGILYEIVSKAELIRETVLDRSKLTNLAGEIYKCLKNEPARLLYAETLVSFSSGKGDTKKAKALTNKVFSTENADFMRCRSKVLSAKGKFEKAAESWFETRQAVKAFYPNTYRENWYWWQSRFYELNCLSKLPEPASEKILHAIEIIKNGKHQIPKPWDKMFDELKSRVKRKN
jgi:hypothetical protein